MFPIFVSFNLFLKPYFSVNVHFLLSQTYPLPITNPRHHVFGFSSASWLLFLIFCRFLATVLTLSSSVHLILDVIYISYPLALSRCFSHFLVSQFLFFLLSQVLSFSVGLRSPSSSSLQERLTFRSYCSIAEA